MVLVVKLVVGLLCYVMLCYVMLCGLLSVYDSNKTFFDKYKAKVWIIHLKLLTTVSPVPFKPLVWEIVLVQQ